MGFSRVFAGAILAAVASAAAADPGASAALCKIDGPGGAVQMAYKAHGGPGFGSDGLTCHNPRVNVPAGEAAGSTATSSEATNPAPIAKKQRLAQTTR